MASAYALFDDAVAKGFGDPPFSLGGGTVLMLRFKHRLSKDIDLFGYDAQWLSVFSPRLNERAAMLAASYTEQSNTIKIVTASGDIDFIIAADVVAPVARSVDLIAGRLIAVDPVTEILAKKLFYRAATFKIRDIYDLSAAIDLAPDEAARAVRASPLPSTPLPPLCSSPALKTSGTSPTRTLFCPTTPMPNAGCDSRSS